MLSCIYGHSGTGKTEYIYDKIRKNMESGIKSFILVPEQSSMDEEKRMIEKLGLSAQLNVEVLTFSRLCNLVFSEVGPLRLKYIDKAGKLFVIKKTLSDIEKNLKYYGKNVHQRGFSQMVSNLISELKRYGIDEDEFKTVSEKIEGTELSVKLSDIALIYEKYDSLISEKYSDSEENLIKAIPGIVKSGLFKGEIFLLGFKSFTPVHHLALNELMKCADIITVLCTDSLSDKNGIFASAVSTWSKLEESAKVNGIDIGKSILFEQESRKGIGEDLVHLKNNYFKYPDYIYKEETPNIFLVSAKDSYDEVVNCGEIISKLCRTKGYKYNDFLVLARNPENYYAGIKAVFEERNIRFFSGEKKSLSSNAFIKKILSVLEILAYGFSYERIMPVVRFCGDCYTRNEADTFENYVIASNITHKYWEQKEDWTFEPDKDRIDIETVNKVKRHTVNSVLDLKDSIKDGKKKGERKTVREICNAIIKWVEKENIGRLMADRVNQFNESGKITQSLEYSRAWNVFSSIITQLEASMGDDTITYEKFYEMVREAFSETEINVIPPLSDQVVFASIDTFRSSGAKVVFVLGLTDGVFPKGYIEDGMLSDAERDLLAEYDIELAPTADFKRKEEQNLIYNVLAAPSERLYLSSPIGDKEGKAKSPSEIIERVKRLFPRIETISCGGEISESPFVIFKTLLAGIVKAEGKIDCLSKQDKVIYDYFAESDLGDELKEFTASVKNYEYGENLTKAMARELYGEKLMLSVSKLEKYNACAFSYFMNYGLFAKERLVAGFEANNTGSILHEILELYLSGLKEENVDYERITYDECRRKISQLAEEVTRKSDELLYETSPYYRYIALRMKGVATATAWEIVRFYANSCFRPFGFEVEIGGEGVFSGMKIQLSDGEAEVRGFIDRIDIAEIDGEKYINIVDYKSSVKSTNERLETAGIQIQPLVYAGIAGDNLKATPSGMMYIHMTEPILKFENEPDDEVLEKERRKKIEIKGIVLGDDRFISMLDRRTEQGGGYIPSGKSNLLSREDLVRRIENAHKKAMETAEKIMSGAIGINPHNDSDFSACRYCEFYKVCGRDKKQI